jgi:hypothetical protein
MKTTVGDMALQVEQGVKFDSALVFSELRPGERERHRSMRVVSRAYRV